MLLFQQFFYLLIGLGVLLGLPALWMFSRAMWPAMVERSREIASRSLFVNFLCGLPVVGLALVLTQNAGKLKQIGGIGVAVLIGLLIMWALIGVAGLAAHIGASLWPDCKGDDAWRGMLRGSLVVSGVLAIPFIGWYVLLLILMTVGLGIRVRILFAAAPKPALVPAARSGTRLPAQRLTFRIPCPSAVAPCYRPAALGGAGSLASCERATSLLTESLERATSLLTEGLGQGMPDVLDVCDGAQIDPEFHLLSRAAFGPWPGDVPRLKTMGRDAWIEEQLDPASIDDSLCHLRAGGFESLMMEPGNAYEFDKNVLHDQITRHALLRATYSRRQLFEVMVEFWTDHLNIDLEKGDCAYLKPTDDREVVRAHALGNFRDLIMASAKSPAMLTYLDGRDNKVRRDSDDKPNENYGRELIELHTLGVHGGYTQNDVFEAARCLTGWTVDHRPKLQNVLNPFATPFGRSYFREDWHDDGEKKILGRVVAAGGGSKDIEQLVDIVCAHASTARFIATKLCRRFVSYATPEALVNRVAAEFTKTQGDIKSLLRVILRSEEFASTRGNLLKRPFRFVVSALRATGADTHAHQLLDYLHRMGQALFQHPTPDGYPDAEGPWLGTLMWRWNLAFALAAGNVPTVEINSQTLAKSLAAGNMSEDAAAKLVAHFTGRKATSVEVKAIAEGANETERVGLVLASPAFQRC